MVKNRQLTFIFLFVFLAGGCIFHIPDMLYSSDISDRRKEMNNFIFLDTLPALAAGGGAYSFVVLTDTHIEGGNPDGLERLPKLIEENAEIKFVAVLGDITTNGGDENFRKYMEIADDLAGKGVPFYPVIGNHDLFNNGWSFWKYNIGSTIYRIDNADTTLIFLDSANIFFGKEQIDWLENQLKAARKNLFIFTHAPLFASGPVEWLQTTDANERARIVSLLRNKNGIMFSGHSHGRRTTKAGNFDFISIESFRDDKTYCIVSVSDSGIISCVFEKL